MGAGVAACPGRSIMASVEPTATATPQAQDQAATPPTATGRTVARITAIFSVATGLSRIAGLVREIVASSYFATSGAFSAFTIAFQVPNVVRSLFADAALSAAFVPVFTELLEQGRRKEAFRLASTLFFLILTVLGAISVLFIVGAGSSCRSSRATRARPSFDDLSRRPRPRAVPVVLILRAQRPHRRDPQRVRPLRDPALSPLVWNFVILGYLIRSNQILSGDEQLYGYAVGVVAGTAVQFAMAIPQLNRIGFRLRIGFSFRNRASVRSCDLMLPVTIGLGLINFNLLINSTLGSLVSDQAGARDRRRLPHLHAAAGHVQRSRPCSSRR